MHRSTPRHTGTRAAALIGVLVSSPGCPHGEQSSAGRQDAASLPALSAAPRASSVPARSATATVPRDAVGPAPAGGEGGSSFAGGSWESCYAGYSPEGEPAKDVERLGLLCGPYHGMRQVRPGDAGRLGASEQHERSFRAERGACFRVSTVCDASMGTVEVELVGPDDGVLVRSAPGRWSVMPARGPWCAEREEDVRVRVKAGSAGVYAMQLWLLP